MRWGGGGGDRGSELPASRTLHSRFPPPSVAVPASVCFSYCEILCQCCEMFFISPGSHPLWISRLPPPLLPPPVDFPRPLLPGSRPPFPPHQGACHIQPSLIALLPRVSYNSVVEHPKFSGRAWKKFRVCLYTVKIFYCKIELFALETCWRR